MEVLDETLKQVLAVLRELLQVQQSNSTNTMVEPVESGDLEWARQQLHTVEDLQTMEKKT